jgi:methionine synthase I (cobalamin-dependent)
MSSPASILEQLLARSLGGGGIGSALQAAGHPLDSGTDRWSLVRPELVRKAHRDYAVAGAGWSATNTFGLQLLPSEERVNLARAAVQNARIGAPLAPVLASIGPLPFDVEPVRVYQETVAALAAAGPDAYLVETITGIRAGEAAVRAAAETGALVLATFTPGEAGDLLDGTRLEVAAGRLTKAGAQVLGVNCGSGPESLIQPVERLVACGEGPVLAAPNAGIPTIHAGRAVYSLQPDSFARAAIELRELGARLIAGCCGVGPEHIRAARIALGLPIPEGQAEG